MKSKPPRPKRTTDIATTSNWTSDKHPDWRFFEQALGIKQETLSELQSKPENRPVRKPDQFFFDGLPDQLARAQSEHDAGDFESAWNTLSTASFWIGYFSGIECATLKNQRKGAVSEHAAEAGSIGQRTRRATGDKRRLEIAERIIDKAPPKGFKTLKAFRIACENAAPKNRISSYEIDKLRKLPRIAELLLWKRR